MPHMDGFALTAAIRAAEAPGQHLPIIAITANAMQGEAQRCLDGGMDDYLSKPLRLQELDPMLAKWLPLPARLEAQDVPEGVQNSSDNTPENVATSALLTMATDQLDIWTPDTLTRLVGDNSDFHRHLLEKFLLNAEQQLTRIEALTQAGDASQAANVSHTLKSAARSVGALALGELCQQIETASRAGDAPGCIALMAHLAPAFAQAKANIQMHLGGSPVNTFPVHQQF
jgi:CheY-like chemotaxis protein